MFSLRCPLCAASVGAFCVLRSTRSLAINLLPCAVCYAPCVMSASDGGLAARQASFGEAVSHLSTSAEVLGEALQLLELVHPCLEASRPDAHEDSRPKVRARAAAHWQSSALPAGVSLPRPARRCPGPAGLQPPCPAPHCAPTAGGPGGRARAVRARALRGQCSAQWAGRHSDGHAQRHPARAGRHVRARPPCGR